MLCYGHRVECHLLGNLARAHLKSIYLVLHNQNYCFAKIVQSTEVCANDGKAGESGCPGAEAHWTQMRMQVGEHWEKGI